MSREKQIEEKKELTDIIQKSAYEHGCFMFGGAYLVAEDTYNAGYRKASEVAREIFEEIEKVACVYKLDGDFYIDNGLYAELKKKYTEGE